MARSWEIRGAARTGCNRVKLAAAELVAAGRWAAGGMPKICLRVEQAIAPRSLVVRSGNLTAAAESSVVVDLGGRAIVFRLVLEDHSPRAPSALYYLACFLALRA